MQNKEYIIVTHRDGRKEYLTVRKYWLLKTVNRIFKASLMAIVITIIIISSLICNNPEDALLKITFIEFISLLFSGICWLAFDMFLH